MKFELSIKIKLDPYANFLVTFFDNFDVIGELIEASLYDIDDVIVEDCEVKSVE